MPSVFTRIIDGDLPGRFVWRDPLAVAFLSIHPLRPGHTLVVPRVEIDQWTDLDLEVARHCMGVAHAIGRAVIAVYGSSRAGLIVAGFEVPHAHLHVFPTDAMHEFDFRQVDRSPDPAALDADAARIRAALVALGHPEASDQSATPGR